MLAAITWNPDPVVFHLGAFVLRWYSLFIALSFLLAYSVAAVMVRREQYPASIQENGIFPFLIGLIVGARLGHCLFYEPGYYLLNPLEMLMIWKGGLSSHGAILGMVVGMWFYARKVKLSPFWFYDKLALAFVVAGSLIRIGNLMNSEAVGCPTSLPWGFVFIARGEDFARHPAQLYEALAYLLIFLLIYPLHMKRWSTLKKGYLMGLTLTMVFTFRFFIEWIKDTEGIPLPFIGLNTGQLLSIPMVLFGGILTWTKRGNKQLDDIR